MSKSISQTVFSGMPTAAEILGKFQSALIDVLLSSAALAIGSTSTAAVKVVSVCYAFINGGLVSCAVQEAALSGTVTNGTYNVFLLSADTAGTITALMGTGASALSGVVLPAVSALTAVVGLVIVHPTGTGNFVGGTTALSDVTVVPNAVYLNTVGAFNPNVLAL